MDKFNVRPMTREEFDLVVDWAAEEGWNPGLADAETFFETDPGGYWCGVMNGEMVASISAVKYGADFAFVGFYIVKKGYRGRGYGLELWKRAMESLGNRNVGLDGVVGQRTNYEQSGFRFAYSNARYEGVTRKAENLVDGIECVSEDQLEAILSYDAPFFPAGRPLFMQKWLLQSGSTVLASWRDGQPIGYGVIRPCRRGYKIGPLFADNAETAENLFVRLQSTVPSGEPFYLDIPEGNGAALALASKYKMSKVFETARMYTGDFPALPLTRLYGVTNLEMG